MFNAGIVASGRSASKVKLTSRQIEMAQTVFFHGDGRLEAGATQIPGEWYAGVQAGIGSQYQIRYTLQAGGDPTSSMDHVSTTWQDISGMNGYRLLSWPIYPPGRVMIEIRDKATLTIQASAQFWAPGFAP